jgi:DNA-binding NarL/FixJ family response regulator
LTAPASAEQRRRLIIADDDFVIQSLLSASLDDVFDVVGVASDSEEAIELARDTRPDVALVDVQMPKGGGRSAVRGIVEVSPDTAIVVLSGDESDAMVRELIGAGAVAYCRKGIEPAELSELLNDAIDARTKERARALAPLSPVSTA